MFRHAVRSMHLKGGVRWWRVPLYGRHIQDLIRILSAASVANLSVVAPMRSELGVLPLSRVAAIALSAWARSCDGYHFVPAAALAFLKLSVCPDWIKSMAICSASHTAMVRRFSSSACLL